MKFFSRSDLMGWAMIALFAAAFDVSSIKNGKQTLSSTVWNAKNHPLGGPAAVAIWAALTYHLFIFEKKIEIVNVITK